MTVVNREAFASSSYETKAVSILRSRKCLDQVRVAFDRVGRTSLSQIWQELKERLAIAMNQSLLWEQCSDPWRTRSQWYFGYYLAYKTLVPPLPPPPCPSSLRLPLLPRSCKTARWGTAYVDVVNPGASDPWSKS